MKKILIFGSGPHARVILSEIIQMKGYSVIGFVDEVIKKANNQTAGLAAYVCTKKIELANKTSEALEVGMVAVNTPFISNAETPFGGIKQSGYGREGGSMGIKDYLNIKYTHLGLN